MSTKLADLLAIKQKKWKERALIKEKTRLKKLKRKNAIELTSKAELEPTLLSIKKAVDNGEFDRLLEEQLAYGSRLTKQ